MIQAARHDGVPFQFEGRTYKVEARTRDTELLYQRWLEREALQAVRRHSDDMTPEERRTHAAAWQQSVATGTYKFGSAACYQAMFSADGSVRIAYLQLSQTTPDLAEATVARVYADDAAWKQLTDAMAEANGATPAADEEEPAA